MTGYRILCCQYGLVSPLLAHSPLWCTLAYVTHTYAHCDTHMLTLSLAKWYWGGLPKRKSYSTICLQDPERKPSRSLMHITWMHCSRVPGLSNFSPNSFAVRNSEFLKPLQVVSHFSYPVHQVLLSRPLTGLSQVYQPQPVTPSFAPGSAPGQHPSRTLWPAEGSCSMQDLKDWTHILFANGITSNIKHSCSQLSRDWFGLRTSLQRFEEHHKYIFLFALLWQIWSASSIAFPPASAANKAKSPLPWATHLTKKNPQHAWMNMNEYEWRQENISGKPDQL